MAYGLKMSFCYLVMAVVRPSVRQQFALNKISPLTTEWKVNKLHNNGQSCSYISIPCRIWVGMQPEGVFNLLFRNYRPNSRKKSGTRDQCVTLYQNIFQIILFPWKLWPPDGGGWGIHPNEYMANILKTLLILKQRNMIRKCNNHMPQTNTQYR